MKVTVNDVLAWKTCYKQDEIKKLFNGREYLTGYDIACLDIIPLSDTIWALAHMDTGKVVTFAQNCTTIAAAVNADSATVADAADAAEIYAAADTTLENVAVAVAAAAFDAAMSLSSAIATTAAFTASAAYADSVTHETYNCNLAYKAYANAKRITCQAEINKRREELKALFREE